MTTAMEDVLYERRQFNENPRDSLHPHHLTERHYIYHLREDQYGNLICIKDADGNPITSPRTLRDMSIFSCVSELRILQHGTDWKMLPGNVFPLMLSEAIMNRETSTIVWLIARWPMPYLRVYDMIPDEDFVENDYLTIPFGRDKMCLADCFVLGLLKIKPECNLRYLDFTRFEKDRKLSKELCRLPVLWLKPEDRTLETIHERMSECIEVSKDKTQKFLNRISRVYRNMENEIKHGQKIDPVTILLDLKVNIDDVPLGLSLQRRSPFRFACSRLWLRPVPDVTFTPCNLGRMLDPSRITHFEYENENLSHNEDILKSLVDGLCSFKNIFGLSLPNSLDLVENPEMAVTINNALKQLKYLQRLNFSYCNLKSKLSTLLDGLEQRLVYLNVKDARLTEEDFFFLVQSRCLRGLKELNLSCNNLAYLDQVVIALLERMTYLVCLSISYCSLPIHSLVLVVRECKESSRLKCLCLQGYTPLPEDEMFEILQIAAGIPSLQKLLLFPAAYAFPGNNDQERQRTKFFMLTISYRYLDDRGRSNIVLQ